MGICTKSRSDKICTCKNCWEKKFLIHQGKPSGKHSFCIWSNYQLIHLARGDPYDPPDVPVSQGLQRSSLNVSEVSIRVVKADFLKAVREAVAKG